MESTRTSELVGVISGYLKKIMNNTSAGACCVTTTSAGVSTNVPAGFGSVSIVLLTGSIDVHMSDGSIYPMTTPGEVLVQGASANNFLPAYTITGTGTWKWSAIK